MSRCFAFKTRPAACARTERQLHVQALPFLCAVVRNTHRLKLATRVCRHFHDYRNASTAVLALLRCVEAELGVRSISLKFSSPKLMST